MATFLQNDPPQVYSPRPIDDAQRNWNEYHEKYRQSIADPSAFWGEVATKYVSWFAPFHHVCGGDFTVGDTHWFSGGKLNASYNCIDRHLATRADQTAILWEGDEIGTSRHITYRELHQNVCRIANVLKHLGVRKGDVVTIYLPMIPEVAYTMLACARIGAVHSVVFAGFSADSLRDRIRDCHSKFVVTSNIGKRGGKKLDLQRISSKAAEQCPHLQNVLVFSYPDTKASVLFEKDVLMDDLLPKVVPYCPCEWMDSEDTLFILYTSGSTGKPKGVAHTTGGYLVNVSMTTKTSFDVRDGDVYCCAADAGWITGHSYIVYGPLSLGTTTTMFESIPTYPTPYRYWDLVQRHKVNIFYTAPTAIRALMRFPTDPIQNFDLSSLRVLGTVGEPINPEAWKWYNTHVGRDNCTIADTYWQTETGAHIAANLPGTTPMKPGSCTLPYFGIDFAIIDPSTGQELHGNDVEGVLCIRKPWPSIARTVYGDHDRYLNVYLRPYPGFYFTGDGAKRDADGYYWITGRVDDVINPSGHRIGTAEIESALVACSEVSEAAVVGFPHEIKGEGIGCFVILREGVEPSDEVSGVLKNSVRNAIGPIATPDFIVFCDLPKTRSGKIMRRILRKVAAGEEDSLGDLSTLADPTVVQRLIDSFKEAHYKMNHPALYGHSSHVGSQK